MALEENLLQAAVGCVRLSAGFAVLHVGVGAEPVGRVEQQLLASHRRQTNDTIAYSEAVIGDGWVNVCSLSTLKYVNLHQFSYTGSTLTPTLGKSLRYSYLAFEPSADGFNFCSLVFNDPVTIHRHWLQHTKHLPRHRPSSPSTASPLPTDVMITDFAGDDPFVANFMYFPGLRLHPTTGEITFGYSVVQSLLHSAATARSAPATPSTPPSSSSSRPPPTPPLSTSDYMCFALPTKSTTDFVNIVVINNLPTALAPDTSKTTRDFTFAQIYNDFALTA